MPSEALELVNEEASVCLHINTFVRRDVDGMLGHHNLFVVSRGIGNILFLLQRRRRDIAKKVVKIDQKC